MTRRPSIKGLLVDGSDHGWLCVPAADVVDSLSAEVFKSRPDGSTLKCGLLAEMTGCNSLAGVMRVSPDYHEGPFCLSMNS